RLAFLHQAYGTFTYLWAKTSSFSVHDSILSGVEPPRKPVRFKASAPSTSWVVPLAPLHQEPTSAPVASWVVPLEPLHQELTSAPVAAINFSHPIGTEKMCDSIVYAPMDELEFERLLGLATLFNDNDEWPIDFTELQELSELLGKLKSCVDVAIDNAPEGAKS
ncbi:hypothetical protein RHA66_32600, partial [Pseudomonas aeruginosa]|nr:hypothetical protein [Pseudomonas aeruginosa]MDR9476001.1 hypothetical protein [Pseudomonas aeruginosa]